METKFKFNSQVCTDKKQSERLLALGLKKETADMCWETITLHGKPITYPSQDVWMNSSIITNNHFPAWSLHRLWEIGSISHLDLVEQGDILKIYDLIIDNIEFQIKEGYFPKEYLV